MNNIEKVSLYQEEYARIMNKLQDFLEKEIGDFNEYIEDVGVSVLPDNIIKNGKEITQTEMQEDFKIWQKRKQT